MPTIPDLLHASLTEVFGQRDGALRLARMRELYAADIAFSDDEGTVTGLDAVDAKVQALLDRTPGFVFRAAGPAREVQDLGVLDWDYGPVDAAPVVSGTDVVLVRDGRIHSLYTYLRSQP
jgi:hypothetical protein